MSRQRPCRLPLPACSTSECHDSEATTGGGCHQKPRLEEGPGEGRAPDSLEIGLRKREQTGMSLGSHLVTPSGRRHLKLQHRTPVASGDHGSPWEYEDLERRWSQRQRDGEMGKWELLTYTCD